MKLHLKLSFLLILVLSLTITGCLKDKEFDNGQIQSVHSNVVNPKVVEIKVTAASASNVISLAFDNSSNDTVVDLIPVNLATPDAAPEDLHVTLVQNDQLVTDYNAAHTDTTVTPDNPNPSGVVTHYLVPTAFTVVNPGGVVTIPKGSHTGYLQIKFKASDFIGETYALAFTINKIDESGYVISGNLQNGMAVINIKNKYDGVYSLNINTTGWAAYGIADGVPGDYPSDFEMLTVNGSTVSLNNPSSGFGALQPALTSAGGPTAFGATGPVYAFDPATDVMISVTNSQPDDGRGRAFQLNTDPAFPSYFDPATRTIYANYIMKQNGRPNQFIYCIFTYVGSR